MTSHPRRSLAALTVAVLVAACASPRPASSVLLYVDAEPLTRADATRLVVTVRGGPPGTTAIDAADPFVYPAPIAWPIDLTIAPAGNDAMRLFEIEATAYDAGGALVTQARVRAGYVAGEQRTLRLVLEDACRALQCPTGLACRAGRCGPLEPGPDGGVIQADAGMPPPCTGDDVCSDGNPCNGSEVCKGGECHPSTDRVDCDDHVDCTVDSCDGTGCVHAVDDGACTAAAGGRCDPTNGCQYDTCNAATCVSNGCQTATCQGNLCVRTFACAAGETCCGSACVPSGCDDGAPCTTDFCDTTASACRHTARMGNCDDGDPCTVGDVCDGTTCVGAGTLACDDANPCTTDACRTGVGCAHDANAASCDDGNACTVGDTCGGGTCQAGAPMACDDGVGCTTDGCTAGTCGHVASDAVCGPGGRCDPQNGCQSGSTCVQASCAASAGPCETATCVGDVCVHTGCATGTMCCGSACVAAGCDDGNPCTDDACDGTQCTHAPNTRGCDDGNPCTRNDQCAAAACVGQPDPCDDTNACTADSCGASGCVHTPRLGDFCDDGNDCTFDDTCNATGICLGRRCPTQTVCCNGACVRPQQCL
ncbi:MAG: hypothetical protein U0234_14645 [Sandaracinus sp.]